MIDNFFHCVRTCVSMLGHILGQVPATDETLNLVLEMLAVVSVETLIVELVVLSAIVAPEIGLHRLRPTKQA